MKARALKRARDARTTCAAIVRAEFRRIFAGRALVDIAIYCSVCHDGEGGCAFPYYGAAPHRCYYTLGLQIGQSQELPEAEWPANFRLDPESGACTGYPRAGIYTHCLHCGAGATP